MCGVFVMAYVWQSPHQQTAWLRQNRMGCSTVRLLGLLEPVDEQGLKLRATKGWQVLNGEKRTLSNANQQTDNVGRPEKKNC